jgi:hypothetical protein
LIVMASPPGGLALSISAAACADSSDSNVSIDVPVFSLSLTHCAETKPDAWRIRGIPSCLKKLLACSKSWERAPNHQCVHCCLPSATGPADPTPLANGCEVPDRPRPRPRGWASRRSRRTPGRSRARGRRDRRALTMMTGTSRFQRRPGSPSRRRPQSSNPDASGNEKMSRSPRKSAAPRPGRHPSGTPRERSRASVGIGAGRRRYERRPAYETY